MDREPVAATAAGSISGIALPASPEFLGTFAFRGTPLHRGEVGSQDVKALQSRLNDLRFGPLVVDGDFGDGTRMRFFTFRQEIPRRTENHFRLMVK